MLPPYTPPPPLMFKPRTAPTSFPEVLRFVTTLDQHDQAALEDIKAAFQGKKRLHILRRAIHLAASIARLRLAGIAHFGYVDRDGKFQHFPTLFV